MKTVLMLVGTLVGMVVLLAVGFIAMDAGGIKAGTSDPYTSTGYIVTCPGDRILGWPLRPKIMSFKIVRDYNGNPASVGFTAVSKCVRAK